MENRAGRAVMGFRNTTPSGKDEKTAELKKLLSFYYF